MTVFKEQFNTAFLSSLEQPAIHDLILSVAILLWLFNTPTAYTSTSQCLCTPTQADLFTSVMA